MDVKTTFLNGELEDDMRQEYLVCKLHRSIHGLKEASISWNIKFDKAIDIFGFEKSLDEPCIYKNIQGTVVVFLVLYIDDILLIENHMKVLSRVKNYLKNHFDKKDLD